MGFIEDIEAILDETPDERQTGALLGDDARRDRRRWRSSYMRDPEQITSQPGQHDGPADPPDLLRGRRARQVRGAGAHPGPRDADLGDHLLPHQAARSTSWARRCIARGYPAETLHGDLSQTQRDRVMAPLPRRPGRAAGRDRRGGARAGHRARHRTSSTTTSRATPRPTSTASAAPGAPGRAGVRDHAGHAARAPAAAHRSSA